VNSKSATVNLNEPLNSSVIRLLNIRRKQATRQLSPFPMITYAFTTFSTLFATTITARAILQINLHIWTRLPLNHLLDLPFVATRILQIEPIYKGGYSSPKPNKHTYHSLKLYNQKRKKKFGYLPSSSILRRTLMAL
jgi:hypothetical protein